MQLSHIRIELPGLLHMQFMQRVFDDFGTTKAQNEALTMIVKAYVNNSSISLNDVSITRSRGTRCLYQRIPASLKNKLNARLVNDMGRMNCLTAGITALIQLYVNGKISITNETTVS